MNPQNHTTDLELGIDIGRGGDNTRKFYEALQVSISGSALISGAMLSFRFSGQSSLSVALLVPTLLMILLGNFSSWTSIFLFDMVAEQKENMPEVAEHKKMMQKVAVHKEMIIETAEILRGMGIFAFALAFIQMIAMSLLVWILILQNHTMPKQTEIMGCLGIVASICLAFYANDCFVPLCQMLCQIEKIKRSSSSGSEGNGDA